MSDMTGIEIKDVLGLSEPLTKLIETVSAGIGKCYEPIHARRMSEAKAKEINNIGEAIRTNADLPVSYQYGNILVDATDENKLMQRTQNRLLYQESQRQKNIEDVVGHAYNELKDEETVNEEPIDRDWITRFFSIVEDVSTEDMKIIWAKILAGEIKYPGSFSVRTLECVRNINKHEAAVFQKLLPCILGQNNTSFFTSTTEILNKYGISFNDLLVLKEAGLVNLLSMMELTISFSEKKEVFFYGKDCLMKIETAESNQRLKLKGYSLSRMGEELKKVLEYKNNTDYMYDLAEEIVKSNKNRKIVVTIHDITDRNGNIVSYKINPSAQVESDKLTI